MPPGSTLRALTWENGTGRRVYIPVNSDERSVERSARSGMVQPVMRSLRRNHGRLHANHPRRKDQGDGASGTDRREWSRTLSTVSNLQKAEDQRRAPGY